MREDEPGTFYFLKEEGNQRLGGEGGFQGQRCGVGVCLPEHMSERDRASCYVLSRGETI